MLQARVCAAAPDWSIVADGQHPNLAAALADQPAGRGASSAEPLFDRAMTRILTGLLADPACYYAAATAARSGYDHFS